jgi:hypothetical protein
MFRYKTWQEQTAKRKMEFQECDHFFDNSRKPDNFDDVKSCVDEFVKKQLNAKRNVVLVTVRIHLNDTLW